MLLQPESAPARYCSSDKCKDKKTVLAADDVRCSICEAWCNKVRGCNGNRRLSLFTLPMLSGTCCDVCFCGLLCCFSLCCDVSVCDVCCYSRRAPRRGTAAATSAKAISRCYLLAPNAARSAERCARRYEGVMGVVVCHTVHSTRAVGHICCGVCVSGFVVLLLIVLGCFRV